MLLEILFTPCLNTPRASANESDINVKSQLIHFPFPASLWLVPQFHLLPTSSVYQNGGRKRHSEAKVEQEKLKKDTRISFKVGSSYSSCASDEVDLQIWGVHFLLVWTPQPTEVQVEICVCVLCWNIAVLSFTTPRLDQLTQFAVLHTNTCIQWTRIAAYVIRRCGFMVSSERRRRVCIFKNLAVFCRIFQISYPTFN